MIWSVRCIKSLSWAYRARLGIGYAQGSVLFPIGSAAFISVFTMTGS
jgi:hypothetical protein